MKSLSQYLEQENHPFHRLCELYLKALEGGKLPTRAGFNPLDLRRALPNTSILQRMEDGDYFYRIVGSELVGRLGFNPDKMNIKDVIPEQYLGISKHIFDMALQTPCGVVSLYPFPYKTNRVSMIEAICLPMESVNGVDQLFLQTIRGETLTYDSEAFTKTLTIDVFNYHYIDLGFDLPTDR